MVRLLQLYYNGLSVSVDELREQQFGELFSNKSLQKLNSDMALNF